MVLEANTMVFVTGTLVLETKTVVSKPETIILAAGTMVFLIEKIFSLEDTTVFGIVTMVCVTNTMVAPWSRCEENGVSCTDYGLQGFVHRIYARQTELRQSPAGCFWSSSPLTSFFASGNSPSDPINYRICSFLLLYVAGKGRM